MLGRVSDTVGLGIILAKNQITSLLNDYQGASEHNQSNYNYAFHRR